ncbi:hypothetical protein [Brevibacillus parabrevis]|uniref:hypothetical protein n=1 Tax=Brevibacillus parabrevis TaxID=54914 RepID=UPI0028D3EFE3|nr:hypothetical protein [Brevibacillus parabrevis]
MIVIPIVVLLFFSVLVVVPACAAVFLAGFMTTIVISYGLFFFEEKRLAKQQLRRAYQAARAIRRAATVPPVASCQHHIRKKAISQAGTLAEGIAFCFWAEGEGSGQSLIMRTIFIYNEAKYSQLAAYRKQVEGVSSCDAVQRIVTQGYLAQFLAFGVKPVRAPYWEMESPHVKDLTAGLRISDRSMAVRSRKFWR